MTGKWINCDGCDLQNSWTDVLIGGGTAVDWITVTRGRSTSDDRLRGINHFCSEQCLVEFLTKKNEVN